MNRFKQLAVIGLVFGVTSMACAEERAVAPQATDAPPAASVHDPLGLPAGVGKVQPGMVVKRESKLIKSAGGSAQVNTDEYTTTTEYVYVTTVFAFNLAGELVDMKTSEIRTPRN